MKNLEKFGVQELDAVEVQGVEGGFIPLILIGAALLLSGCAATKPAFYYSGEDDPDAGCCLDENYDYVDC